MHQRTTELRQFMEQENLKPADVAEKLGLTANTVRIYCSDNKAGKVITTNQLELLKLKVAASRTQADAANS